jgi:hypothetical protein
MASKDILLVLITYPQATDASEIQEAVSFAVALDARISALACIVQVRAPSQHLLSDAFVAALVASVGEKSSVAAAELSATFEASATKAGVFQEANVDVSQKGIQKGLLTRPWCVNKRAEIASLTAGLWRLGQIECNKRAAILLSHFEQHWSSGLKFTGL